MSQAGPLLEVSGPSIPIHFVTDSGTANPALNTLNIIGGTDISTSASGDTIVITFTGSTNFTWQAVTSVAPANPIQIVPNNGYICNGGVLVTFLLPLAPALGDSFILLSNTARFRINENGGQQICVGMSSSTAGSGYVISNSVGDEIEFVYVGGNVFRGMAPQGTLTLN